MGIVISYGHGSVCVKIYFDGITSEKRERLSLSAFLGTEDYNLRNKHRHVVRNYAQVAGHISTGHKI